MIRCIHQIMPPKIKLPSWMGINGRGDCGNCIPDIKNQHCSGFAPVQLMSKIVRLRKMNYTGERMIIRNAETGEWHYKDTGELVKDNPRPCLHCGKDSIDGDDACLGHLPGVKYACCGHGINDGYIWFENGVYVSGQFRIDKM